MNRIHLNPDHKGAFTKKAKAQGMTAQSYAKKVVAYKKKNPTSKRYSETTLKQARFVINFASKKKSK